MATVYIQKEGVTHVTLKNDTGDDLAQYEFVVIGGKSLVADEAIVNGASGSFHIADKVVVQIGDLVTGEDTFATLNAPVYFDPTSKAFSDTEKADYYRTGIVTAVKNSNGIVEVLLGGDASSESVAPKTIVQKITADASAGIAVAGLVEGDEIIGVSVICTAANANGTLVVETGAGDDITDGIICAVDKVVKYAGTIDDAHSTLPATGAQIISVGGTAANTRGIVVITYIPASA